MLKIKTIYPAFMGEVNVYGIGAPCTFIRLAGCNLRCYYKTKGILCDTPEALSAKDGDFVSIIEIVNRANSLGNKLVCLTGGEPLMQNVMALITELSNRGFHVVVETNGSKSIAPYRHIRNVSFVVDVKAVSSGESERMLEDNYELLDANDFVKFVVDTEEDYEDFVNWVISHPSVRCKIAVGLFWGSKITYQWLIEALRKDGLGLCVFINMQTHKMTCLYDSSKGNDTFKNLFIPKDL